MQISKNLFMFRRFRLGFVGLWIHTLTQKKNLGMVYEFNYIHLGIKTNKCLKFKATKNFLGLN